MFQPQSTRVIQLQRLRQQLLQPMMRIKNSARCHLHNLSTANLRINITQLLLPAPGRVANRPEFFGTVTNSDAVSRVPSGSIRDGLMSRIFTVYKVMSTRMLMSGF